ncbi:unnamed protein product [Prorocentrum cordatum]|uniref:Uncharacterized protein n=1 Tax=Prorocentrum cordatum TaxID=2364126 RepID=A0ABN9VGK9_9DINO|nr:unnamed protein product [Polarella glacialis]
MGMEPDACSEKEASCVVQAARVSRSSNGRTGAEPGNIPASAGGGRRAAARRHRAAAQPVSFHPSKSPPCKDRSTESSIVYVDSGTAGAMDETPTGDTCLSTTCHRYQLPIVPTCLSDRRAGRL